MVFVCVRAQCACVCVRAVTHTRRVHGAAERRRRGPGGNRQLGRCGLLPLPPNPSNSRVGQDRGQKVLLLRVRSWICSTRGRALAKCHSAFCRFIHRLVLSIVFAARCLGATWRESPLHAEPSGSALCGVGLPTYVSFCLRVPTGRRARYAVRAARLCTGTHRRPRRSGRRS